MVRTEGFILADTLLLRGVGEEPRQRHKRIRDG